jgi:3-oxoacyl-[acyl-carrier protein] reductase
VSIFDLDGRVALVTGASRGIGAAAARALSAAGAAVALGCEPSEEMTAAAERVAAELRRAGREAIVVPFDVTDEAAVEAGAERVRTELGSLDVLVANAARLDRGDWEELSMEDWRQTMAVNVEGAFTCCRAAARGMGAGGSLITVGSVTLRLGTNGSVPYIASKGAVLGMTRALARELGPRGIRVNCVQPGAIRTESERELSADDGADERLIALQCLPRRGLPDDLAGAFVYLAAEAGSFVTGQVLTVDGGWIHY